MPIHCNGNRPSLITILKGEILAQDTMASLNQMIAVTGNKFATRGEYAQTYSTTPFDGSQFTGKMNDIVSQGAIVCSLSVTKGLY